MITLPHNTPNIQENALLSLPVAFQPHKIALSDPSDGDIIPEPIQHQLMFWRDVFRIGQFDIGDLTAKVILYNAETGMQVTHKRIFKAVSTFCGKTPRTVRYYYETAVFYPDEVRQMYDALPFSHFVEARVFGDEWQEYLDTAMLNPHKGTSYIRLLLIGESQTLTRGVAVGVAVGVASSEDAEADQYANGYSEPDGSGADICEYSQDKPINHVNIHASPVGSAKSCEVSQDYSQHAALCRVDAMLTATKDILPLVSDAEIDDFTRCKLASACGDILHYLPKVGEYFSHLGE